jgi:hypothetical protein
VEDREKYEQSWVTEDEWRAEKHDQSWVTEDEWRVEKV